VARVAGNLQRRGRHRDQLLRCLPALAMISAAWMTGEALGYLTGTAGRSLTAGKAANREQGLNEAFN
jgi:hypothetical protein